MDAFLEVFDIVVDYMVNTQINLGGIVVTFWEVTKFMVVGGIISYMIGKTLNPN
ncbi:MAG: hypothetical protein IJZ96_01780 [Lachnospiraceae bacterium]|nr:hypothetical protein [Lachnospiraceae bacterium]